MDVAGAFGCKVGKISEGGGFGGGAEGRGGF